MEYIIAALVAIVGVLAWEVRKARRAAALSAAMAQKIITECQQLAVYLAIKHKERNDAEG